MTNTTTTPRVCAVPSCLCLTTGTTCTICGFRGCSVIGRLCEECDSLVGVRDDRTRYDAEVKRNRAYVLSHAFPGVHDFRGKEPRG